MRRTTPLTCLAVGASLLLASACYDLDLTGPVWSDPLGERAATAQGDPATATSTVPSPLVTVDAGGELLELWPFTGSDLQGTPLDPLNLVFPGTDARSIRTALMLLDGNRSAFGPLAAFTCSWKDAMGGHQTAYGTGSGWQGSAIQLECGDYGPIRFHVRLFELGSWTVGGAHFEVQIPGTNQHEVLSWELAEALVTADLVRAGVLAAPPSPTDPITPVPTYRAINPLVYNGLPASLKALTGGPTGSTVEPVPLVNDGRAMVLPFAGSLQGTRAVARREFTLEFDQTIPKPFCMEGPLDYLMVRGPIRFTQHVVEAANGNLISSFMARGRLDLVPVNPLTGETGEATDARVMEQHRSVITDRITLVSSLRLQMILPGGSSGGDRLMATLRVGPGAASGESLSITCGS